MSKIKVNEIEKASGSGITVPTGTSFTITDGLAASTISSGTLASARIPEIPQSKIADQAINEAKLQISNAPTNGYFLSAQSGNTGGLTWAEAGGGGKHTLIKSTSVSGNPVNIDFVHGTGGVVIDSTYDYYVIDIINCASQTDVHMMWFRIMQSGSEYTSGNYVSSMKEWYKASGGQSETHRHNWGINNFPIGQVGASNASGEQNMNVTIRYNPNGVGAEYPNAYWNAQWWQDNNQSVHSVGGGHILDTSGVNAFNGFRFKSSK